MPTTVLIVDDSKLARLVAAKLLRQLKPDWEVAEAANADAAMAIMDERQVDVALLDFNMPGKDGLELATDLRASKPQMPIAVVSANIQDEIIARARSVDATFLAKPLTEEALAGFLSGAALRLRRGGFVTTATVDLTELQRDAFTELVNIGVSKAAASLRKMIGVQVLLSVPAVEIVSQAQAARMIGEREASELVVVQQDFTGAFAGRALLIFPQENGRELVRAVAGEELSPEEVAELEDEALTETGNVILNGCLATMANLLQRTLTMSLPEVMRGDGPRIFRTVGEDGTDALVLFLYINFAVRERDIRGYIAMLMDLPSLESLKLLIDEFVERAIGETEA